MNLEIKAIHFVTLFNKILKTLDPQKRKVYESASLIKEEIQNTKYIFVSQIC